MDRTQVEIFTASFGSFDRPKAQPIPVTRHDDSNAHYPMYNQDARMKAKFYKMLSHRVSDAPLLGWIDGNVQVKNDRFVQDMVDALGDCDVVLSKHPVRASPYDEARFISSEIIKGNKYLSDRYDQGLILREMNGMPTFYQHAPLYYCGIFLRRNSPKVNAAFEDWFMDNVLWSTFDQNSFVKMIHKHGLKVTEISWGEFYDNPHYKLEKHLR